ncbi:MAG TPA: C25 family cysteine peptidase, partial [bacterium]
VPLAEDVAIGSYGTDEPAAVQSESMLSPIALRNLGEADGKIAIQVSVYPFVQSQGSGLERVHRISFRLAGKGIALVRDAADKSRILYRLSKGQPLARSVPGTVLSGTENLNSSFPRFKVLIRQEGLYVIPRALLRKAGWDRIDVDPRFFRMRNAEGEIPIRVIGEDDGSFDLTDAVEFWGEPLWDRTVPGRKRLDVYSEYNVYWLEVGVEPGIRMGQEENRISSTDLIRSRSFLFSQHVETDQRFMNLPYVTDAQDADYWYTFGLLNGGEKREVVFSLQNPDAFATELCRLRIELRGQSYSLATQTADIFINNKLIVTSTWSGNESMVLESDGFSPTILSKNNVLTLVNRATGEELAPIYLDWFEIEYPKLYRAEDNYIRFRPPQGSAGKTCRFQIEGFTEGPVDVYKIASGRIIGTELTAVMDTLGQVGQRLLFHDDVAIESTEYVALIPSKKSLPDSVELVGGIPLRQANRGADYIAIVAGDSLGGDILADLIQARREQGLACSVIRLDSIYNEFNSGIPNPIAIRRFLQYAQKAWNPPPRWVLLVGDGIRDARAPLSMGNVVPVKFVHTVKFGAAASDYWYTLSEDGTASDLAIGRLPVRTQAELKAVVDKIIAYEKSVPHPWKNRYLMIAHGQRNDDLFGLQTETLIKKVIPAKWSPERLFLGGSTSDPDYGGTEDLLETLNNGVGWVNFRGHGGGGVWADYGLLDLENAKRIENPGKLPFITSMTCYTGDFSSPYTCLGEAMLTLDGNGAVAFWGSTST